MMKKLKLYDWHTAHAKMGEYAGWHMPLWYSSVKNEHLAVRNNVGIFDVSHMTEIYVGGKDALKFLQYVATADVSIPPPISTTYTTFLNERGGIKDEGLIYNLGDKYMIVCDAVAMEKLYSWLMSLKGAASLAGDLDVGITNKTFDISLLSVQGPKARAIAEKLFSIDIQDLWWFQCRETEYKGEPVLLSKSGYTGENGFELFVEMDPLPLWENLLELGAAPCGLATRDTTRIEAGYTLYGHETMEKQVLSQPYDEYTPLHAGFHLWEFSPIKWEKDFVGKEALEIQKRMGIDKNLIHLEMVDRGIPREGYIITKAGTPIGEVTSGTQSVITGKGIAIGYSSEGKPGESVEIIIREEPRKATIVTPPFYDPKKYGAFREV
ncbi:MAG: glycine cleavage system aminomethyltransferase GcvT [Theionarchaea archaeon]|nr:glycine cleavage system aminomethyltransferase GcvT [Theionarchaea archaeon]MBU7038036.1 glycine cleavage system aminomethyltransferase GcvT [Theionarchaea archaeon]